MSEREREDVSANVYKCVRMCEEGSKHGCVCMCVCVREREREREREKKKKGGCADLRVQSLTEVRLINGGRAK